MTFKSFAESNKRYTTEYVTNAGKLKQVVFFIAKCIGGEIKAQECEVSEIRWVGFEEAIKLITYDNTRALFEKAINEEKLVQEWYSLLDSANDLKVIVKSCFIKNEQVLTIKM